MTTGILNATLLKVYLNGVAISKATNASLSVSMDTREITNKDSLGWAEFGEGKRSWEMKGDGLIAFDSTVSPSIIFAAFTNRSKCTVRFSTEVSGDKRYEGSAYLTSLEQSGGVEDNATFSFTFQGTGALTEASDT